MSLALPQRIPALQQWLTEQGGDALLIPRADEYQHEEVAAYAERLAWCCNFTGSAGLLIITRQQACLFVDGRYTLQGREQTRGLSVELGSLAPQAIQHWLNEQLPARAQLLFDPELVTEQQLKQWGGEADWQWRPLTSNPIDQHWPDRPQPPATPIDEHPTAFCGQSRDEKIAEQARQLAAQGLDALLIPEPALIAWLLNIRARDIATLPVPLCRAAITRHGELLWQLDPARVPDDLRQRLPAKLHWVHPGASTVLIDALHARGCQRILLDPQLTPRAYSLALEQQGLEIVRRTLPMNLARACKQPAELEGMRQAHHHDALAMVRMLAWLEDNTDPTLSELDVVARIDHERAQLPGFVSLSFNTIAGSGPNGAIVHYRATPASNRVWQTGELLLVDSGGQYRSGTTDITRTVVRGEPSAEQRQHYTLVLKGHIALSRQRFPKGTAGRQLDAIARQPLWQAGLDYAHGTGHGVGSCLSVHEGPQRISPLGSELPLQEGMVLSNEPGYYREGQYGIRIENLVAVQTDPEQPGFFGFETLTQVPYERRLIDTRQLNVSERDWIDRYHRRLAQQLMPELSAAEQTWLQRATAPLE